ncbi:MAG: hypothetical protein IT462_09385 [Planctomycetes bacterium]|nr:hypothetical protein [Planctomycetota bacterium]
MSTRARPVFAIIPALMLLLFTATTTVHACMDDVNDAMVVLKGPGYILKVKGPEGLQWKDLSKMKIENSGVIFTGDGTCTSEKLEFKIEFALKKDKTIDWAAVRKALGEYKCELVSAQTKAAMGQQWKDVDLPAAHAKADSRAKADKNSYKLVVRKWS